MFNSKEKRHNKDRIDQKMIEEKKNESLNVQQQQQLPEHEQEQHMNITCNGNNNTNVSVITVPSLDSDAPNNDNGIQEKPTIIVASEGNKSKDTLYELSDEYEEPNEKTLYSLGDILKQLDSLAPPEQTLPRKYMKKQRRATIRRLQGRIKELFGQNGTTPLLVFINPKSGGNQGTKLYDDFLKVLNPEQLQDLSVTGPRRGLEIFKNAKTFQIMVCGGDGTAGWVLSEIDRMNINPRPPIAVLPLGTGNDLARVLKWGGGYDGEPGTKVLSWLERTTTVYLDRWTIDTEPIGICPEDADPHPPYNVVNNYFSYGVDAYSALKFHLKREKHPERFNSRITNKIYYGILGSVDMMKHSCKNLTRHITLIADGVDVTQRIIDAKVEGIIFLNIQSHAGGTFPWGSRVSSKDNFVEPRMDDGLIEVVGVGGSLALAKYQAGIGHGVRICQCRHVKISSNKKLPVQVDGEPCMLAPSVVTISHRNCVPMLARVKRRSSGINKEDISSRRTSHADDDLQMNSKSLNLEKKTIQPNESATTTLPLLSELCLHTSTESSTPRLSVDDLATLPLREENDSSIAKRSGSMPIINGYALSTAVQCYRHNTVISSAYETFI